MRVGDRRWILCCAALVAALLLPAAASAQDCAICDQYTLDIPDPSGEGKGSGGGGGGNSDGSPDPAATPPATPSAAQPAPAGSPAPGAAPSSASAVEPAPEADRPTKAELRKQRAYRRGLKALERLEPTTVLERGEVPDVHPISTPLEYEPEDTLSAAFGRLADPAGLAMIAALVAIAFGVGRRARGESGSVR